MGCRSATLAQRVEAPAFDALVLVHRDINARFVYGTVCIKATRTTGAWVQAEVETGPGTDVYEPVFEAMNDAGSAARTSRAFCFPVQGGRRYRFVRSGSSSVTEDVLHYSYMDM